MAIANAKPLTDDWRANPGVDEQRDGNRRVDNDPLDSGANHVSRRVTSHTPKVAAVVAS